MPEKVNGNKFSGKSNIASLNSGNTSIDSKSGVQLNSSEQKLATIQKMADNSPYSQRFAQLKSLANKNINPKQPVSQLSKDSHSLPDNVKQGVESLSGISMDDVKVHYNSAKPAQLNAHAYAQGTDIHLASGQEKHLPHEAWHVVQQKQGRVRPTTMMKAKVPINDDQGLEKEADVMGARALQGKFVLPRTEKRIGIAFSSKQPTQLVDDEQQSWSPFGREQPVFDQVNPMHANKHRDKIPGGISNNELKQYVAFLKLFLDDIMNIDFSDAKKAKENNDYLMKLEILSTSLNTTALAVGITSVFALTAVSGGMAPLAALAGGYAVHMATGASMSAAGLGVKIAKGRAKDNLTRKQVAKGTLREGAINLTGNNLMGTEQAGKAAGGEIGGMEGAGLIADAATLGGVLSGGAGALFAMFGLKNNVKTLLELHKARIAIIANFNSIGVTLLQVESQLLKLGTKSSVAEIINPIIPVIAKTTTKIQRITGTFPELPPIDVEM
jgi:hypothetical protein